MRISFLLLLISAVVSVKAAKDDDLAVGVFVNNGIPLDRVDGWCTNKEHAFIRKDMLKAVTKNRRALRQQRQLDPWWCNYL